MMRIAWPCWRSEDDGRHRQVLPISISLAPLQGVYVLREKSPPMLALKRTKPK